MFTVVGAKAGITRIRLNMNHPIYRAHFPGNPITPGVCMVQMVAELLETSLNRSLTLKRITNLKFISTISPVENPVVDVHFDKYNVRGTMCAVKGCITSEDETKAKFSLEFEKEGEG